MISAVICEGVKFVPHTPRCPFLSSAPQINQERLKITQGGPGMKEPAATAIDLLLFAALLLHAAHLRGSPFSHLRRALCLLVLFFSFSNPEKV